MDMFFSTAGTNAFKGSYIINPLKRFDLDVLSMYILQKCYFVLYAMTCKKSSPCMESIIEDI